MVKTLYDTIIRLYAFSIRIASWFNPKARLWMEGRRNWRQTLQKQLSPYDENRPRIWFHVASLGEFEQGRPVIEMFRQRRPDWVIVLSFFSPSGYEPRKRYSAADVVCYLPADTRSNAADWLDFLRPEMIVFIKYEFWANYLAEIKKRGIQNILISASFRPEQPFFRLYGGFWRQMLSAYGHFFVQNRVSFQLLQNIGFQNISVSGDTRIDRVLQIAENGEALPDVEAFVHNNENLTLIAGSTWPPDESLLFALAIRPEYSHFRLIIAPHDPTPQRIDDLTRRFSAAGPTLTLSAWSARDAATPPPRVLLVDTIGLLNRIYRYGDIAYIGGGFGKGIHNTLEPAAWRLPVVFGPRYQKFEEAKQLIQRGGAFCATNEVELFLTMQNMTLASKRQTASEAAFQYLNESRGAALMVVDWIEQQISEKKAAANDIRDRP